MLLKKPKLGPDNAFKNPNLDQIITPQLYIYTYIYIYIYIYTYTYIYTYMALVRLWARIFSLFGFKLLVLWYLHPALGLCLRGCWGLGA